MNASITFFSKHLNAELDSEHNLRMTAKTALTDALESAVAIPLTNTGFTLCSGPDAEKFLQGQLTCNVKTLTSSHASLASHCTPKGRMVSSFRIHRLDTESFLLRSHVSLLPLMQQSLGKYIVFSKAKLFPASEEWIALGLAGKQAARILAELSAGDVIRGVNQVTPIPGGIAFQVDTRAEHFELWVRPEAAECTWTKISQHCQAADTLDWDLLMIRLGIPEVRASTSEMFIPQMLNLQELDAISFNKGCYTGQEIIARTKYRGQLKRHMYRATVSATELPPPGAPIYHGPGEQSVGNTVLAAHADSKTVELLVVLTDDAQMATDLTIDKAGENLRLLTLPYAIPNDTSAT